MMLRPETTGRGFGPAGPETAFFSKGMPPPSTALRAILSATFAPSAKFQICPGNDDDCHCQQHHGRSCKALTEVLRLEHVVVDVFCRHFRRYARTAAGLGDDEIVELDDAAGDDDERGDEDRPHHRNDDEEIGPPHGNAVDAGSLPDILVD